MKKPSPLSAVMVAALDFATRGGGTLVRNPGGYWTIPGMAIHGGLPNEYIGTPTVNALSTRMLLTFTKLKAGRRGTFPIEAKIVGPKDILMTPEAFAVLKKAAGQ